MEQKFSLQTSRAKFIRWMILIISICILLFSLMAAIVKPHLFYLFLIGTLISVISLLALKKFHNSYPIILNIYYLGLMSIVIIAIFGTSGSFNLVRIVWLTLFTLFAFLTLDNKWGWFYLAVTIVTTVLYLNFFFIDIEDYRKILSNGSIPMDTFEFIGTMIFLGLIMYSFEKLNKEGITKYYETIQQLEDGKSIIMAQNNEKTVLLGELHHRVKNNLQIVVSLLRIQEENLKSEDAKKSFQDAIQRIVTMSLIHQKMYETKLGGEVKLEDYIKDLIQNILASYSIQHIKTIVDIHLDHLNVNRIVPLGLILNELITNTLKHAFKDFQDAEIVIKISSINQLKFTLIYSDNGIWKESMKESLGKDLIEIFSSQLDGKYEREINEKGTFYYFTLYDE